MTPKKMNNITREWKLPIPPGTTACPFCGQQQLYIQVAWEPEPLLDPPHTIKIILWYWVQCDNESCFTQGPPRLSENEAVQAWTSRPPLFRKR